jgi:hypothetical protein
MGVSSLLWRGIALLLATAFSRQGMILSSSKQGATQLKVAPFLFLNLPLL